MTKVCHDAGIPVIYHGCGNVNRIFEDFIETGVDAYNPLEAKAGLDVVDLRRRYGHRIGVLRQHGRAHLGRRHDGRAEGRWC